MIGSAFFAFSFILFIGFGVGVIYFFDSSFFVLIGSSEDDEFSDSFESSISDPESDSSRIICFFDDFTLSADFYGSNFLLNI